ncbi:MAG: S8 family serine peptidase [Bacteroidota bacterium]|nr:S8 family serine peptidase [Bacteroidota bacterium]
MGLKNLKLISIILVIFSLTTYAKLPKFKYAVYFVDKKGTSYAVSEPKKFLSDRALVRRLKQNIPITEKDLPVSQTYLDSLKWFNAAVWYTSKWFNAAYVICDSEEIKKIKELSFVTKIQILKNSIDTIQVNGRSQRKSKGPSKFRITTSQYGGSANQIQMLCADQMHEEGYKGKDMLIAVFDGGFRNGNGLYYFDHLYKQKRIIDTFDFVDRNRSVFDDGDSEHGTSVLSTIAAYAPGSLIGTAYEASFLLYRTEDEATEYPIEEFNWLLAAEKADSAGADIINSSLGYTTFDDGALSYVYKDLNGKTTIVARAASHCARVGMIVVNSAGNEGGKSWNYISSPGDADSILTVGSVDKDGNPSAFSGFGPTSDNRVKPDISAKGSGTTIGKSSNTISTGNGTSFSSPVAAGFVAGMWQAFPELNNIELINLIKKSSNLSAAPNNKSGWGIPCYTKAKIAYLAKENKLYAASVSANIYPNPATTGPIIFGVTQNDTGKTYRIEIFNTSASLLFSQVINNAQISNELNLDIKSLSSGLYFVKVWNDEFSRIYRLVKN